MKLTIAIFKNPNPMKNILYLSAAILLTSLNVSAQTSLKVKDVRGFGNPVNIAGKLLQVGLFVQNTGSITLTDINFGYEVMSGPQVFETWNGSLAPNDTATLYMTTPFVVPAGSYIIQTGVLSLNGLSASVDSLVLYYFGQAGSITTSVYDDFESGSFNWETYSYLTHDSLLQAECSDPAVQNWQLGTPAYGSTSGAHSGSNAWDINLNSAPDTFKASVLYSPIVDLTYSYTPHPYVSFWQNRNTNTNVDGMRIEYNIDSLTWNGWTVLGSVGDPLGTNWYNNGSLAASGEPGWDGSSVTWTNSIYDLSPLMGNRYLQFRMVYNTDGSGNSADGISIDDFMICHISGNVFVTNVSCNGMADGGGDLLQLQGGTPPYSYLWTGGNTTSSISGLAGGAYSCIVTDAMGCTATFTFTVLEPTALVVSVSNSQTPCGTSNGTITASIAGGTAPYTYLWSNGETAATINNLPAGTYTITVTDPNGCTATAVSTVSSSNGPVLFTDSLTQPTCTGGTNGAIYLSTAGGNPPYSYLWNNGAVTEDNTGLVKGTYTVTVTDNNSCQNTYLYYLHELIPGAAINIIQQPTSCGACDGIVSFSSTGGTPPFNYWWTNSSTLQTVTSLCTGGISCYVTDSNGCIGEKIVNLYTASFSVTATSTPSSCFINDGTATAIPSGGTPPYSYQWNTGANTQIISSLNSGFYSLWLSDATNCYAYTTVLVDDSCHGVWPGDANYDLSVNNNDLLNIGVGYGFTGPVRPAASLAWVAQTCPGWSNYFATGANYKNADCNGDGIIDDNDTTAILLNYGKSHAFYKNPFTTFSLPGAPDLYLVVSVDSTGLSDTITVEVNLGNGSMPVDSIYGLAFSIQTDPQLVDTSFAQVDFGNCWMGTTGLDLLPLFKNRINNGTLDIALVRTDHNNVSGNGPIARATLVTTDNIAGKGISASSASLAFAITNVTAITSGENPLYFNQVPDSVIIDSAFVSGIQDPTSELPLIKIAPNPADKSTWIYFDKLTGEKIEIEITSMEGRRVLSRQYTLIGSYIRLNLEAFENGLYCITLKSRSGLAYRKLIIQH
jgi:hypothetical protein